MEKPQVTAYLKTMCGWSNGVRAVMAKYVSEYTEFINELKRKNPKIDEGQQIGRALLWDKQIDRDVQRRFQEAKVPQQGYPYQNHVGPAAAK